jgi:hypothetical protein
VKSSTDLYRSTTPEEKGSQHNSQLNDRLIHRYVPSFSPTTVNEAVGKRQAYVDNQLLGLPGTYHRHTFGTFNACSRGRTNQSLTDTGGGYNLEGTDFLHITHRPSQLTVSPFHLRVPLGLQFNHNLPHIPNVLV